MHVAHIFISTEHRECNRYHVAINRQMDQRIHLNKQSYNFYKEKSNTDRNVCKLTR